MSSSNFDVPAVSHSFQHLTQDFTHQSVSSFSRYQALEGILAGLTPETAIIATTGKTGRELFTIKDDPAHLYQVGSMGCASAIGLGVALNTEQSVCVLDGDGAALMKLGNWSTIGQKQPKNLVHIVLDNGTYDSTGGQHTAAGSTDFAAIAVACGYRQVIRCNDASGMEQALLHISKSNGPTLIHVAIAPGSMKNLARPDIHPREVASRFRAFVTQCNQSQSANDISTEGAR